MRGRLAFDTSGERTYVAVEAANGRICERVSRPYQMAVHNEELAYMVDELLEEAAVDYQDISAVCVGLGPGSFTGLRIGLSFAKGLSFALRVPLCGVSSLKASAWEFKDRGEIIVSVGDAGRKGVYAAVYFSRNGLKEVFKDSVLPEDELREVVADCAVEYGTPLKEVLWCGGPLRSGFMKRGLLSPQHAASSVLDIVREQKPAEFDIFMLTRLEPRYILGVNAKTIAERKKSAGKVLTRERI